jgi:hypothetical protein
MCNRNSSENFFGISDSSEKEYFLSQVCNLTDNQLVGIMKTVSSNIDFSRVKRRVNNL